MKQSMRHLTFLLLAMLSTIQTWAAPELIPSITGGSLAFYSEEACTTRLDAAAISSLTAGTTVYFKVKTDGLHTTAVTAADFTVEVGSGTGAAESRRSIDIGTDPTVTIEATATPGVFSFSVLDAKIVIRATLPERTDTGISVNYIDAEGNEATATGVYVLDGSEDMLGTVGTTTWFVCQTPVSPEHPEGFVFDHQLTLRGDVNVIIADGAKITVNSPDGNGIYNSDGSIGFYGQSTGDSQGQLSVTGLGGDGICAGSYYSSCDVTISSLKVVIEGKKKGVYASNNITVWGGEMTVTSDEDEAFLGSKGVSITGISKLSAQSATDRGVSSYGDITIVGGSDGAVVNVNDETDSDATAIYAYGNISITGISKLTAGNTRSSSGIYANDTVAIEGGEVTVTSNSDEAIYGYKGVSITGISKLSAQSTDDYGIYSSQGDVTIVGGSDGAVVNVNDETGSTYTAIYANGNISITGISKLTVGNVRSSYGIYANRGAVTIEGGEVTVRSKSYAIYGYIGGVSITGISKLSAQSTDDYGIYSPQSDVTIVGGSDGAVVNVNGETASDDTAIYANGNISITGISKLTAGNARSNYGIYANDTVTIEGGEVTVRSKYYAIYGYSGVSITGISKLSAQSATNYGIYSSQGDVTIVGGSDGAVVNVNDETGSDYTAIYAYQADISITGISKLTVGNARSSYGIYTNRGAVTIEGGEVTVRSKSYAIYGYNGITLSLTDEAGFIYASSYYDTVDIADGQTFYDEEGNTYTGTIDDNGDIAGKTLRLLGNGKSCASVTFAPAGFCTYYNMQSDVELPKGVKARIVTATGNSEGTLVYETIADGDTDNNIVPAGTAMMLQTTQSEGDQQKALILMAHSDASPEAPSVNLLHGSDDEGLTTGNGKHYKLTYGSDNTPNANVFGWYWAAVDGAAFISAAHRVWLVLPNNLGGARSFLALPDDETTGVGEMRNEKGDMRNADAWYTLNGVKLSGKPTQKGVYIHGGKKMIVK